jgi:periplasmic divalent cation tolerance protein
MAMRAKPTARLVLCTVPDEATAATIARTLVDERLAACVNRLPGLRSTYRWQGAVHDEAEVLLLIKTTSARHAALAERLRALHPHDVPEILAFDATDGLPDYLAWIAESTAPE